MPRSVDWIDEQEIETLMAMPAQREKNELKRSRDYALLQVLFGSGLRVTEMLGLTRDQIRNDSSQYQIIGKGKKLRSVFFTQEALNALSEYLQQRTDDDSLVFVNLSSNAGKYGNHLSRNSVEALVKKYASLA
jgi:site-specific recombinase XerD